MGNDVVLLDEQDAILSQVGELFDHAGVNLESSENTQASDDLKLLGSILRTRFDGSPFDLTSAQQPLAELGERYGIKPIDGSPYRIRNLVQIAEQIFDKVLK